MAAHPESRFEVISTFVLALVIFGWFATHYFTEIRERRKELRSALDKTCARLWDIETEAREFHMRDTFDESESRKLVRSMQQLHKQMTRLSRMECESSMVAFLAWRQAISLDNFELSTFSRQSAECELLVNIGACTMELEDCIERRYLELYPPRFPYFALPPCIVEFGAVVGGLARCTTAKVREKFITKPARSDDMR